MRKRLKTRLENQKFREKTLQFLVRWMTEEILMYKYNIYGNFENIINFWIYLLMSFKYR